MAQPTLDSSETKKTSPKVIAILEGAMAEFLAHGYAATSMDRIAQTAGVSKATIYSHFQDKADLFAAIIQQLAEHKFNTVFDPHDATALQGEPRTVLRKLGSSICDQANHNNQFCEFMRLLIGESGHFPELAQPYIDTLAQPMIMALARYLANCPELQLKDTEATARIFIGSLVYFVMLQEVLHGKDRMPMEQDRIIDNLLNLIAPL